MTTEKPGLRERKKEETRRTLSDVACSLAMERGASQVRVEDIAAAANVSMRTFNNYFCVQRGCDGRQCVSAFRAGCYYPCRPPC
ncbi:TetR/AcrR family transcriptional regulator [Paenibacillus rhizoplanae]